jgi:hypothetical protein
VKNKNKKDCQRIDKTKILITSLGDEPNDKTYWRSQTPEKRIHHIELLRALNYGDKASSRLQRFFEIAERKQS